MRNCLKLMAVFAFFSLLHQAWPHAGQPKLPLFDNPTKLRLPNQPEVVADLKVDASGNIYVLDQGGAKVLVYSPEHVLIRTIGGPGVGHGRFRKPLAVSISGDSLAVAEGDTIQFFSTKTGDYLQTLKCPSTFYLSDGFFLTPERVVFDSPGFLADPVLGQAVQELSLFSTDWNGKDLRIAEKIDFKPGDYEQSATGLWYAINSATAFGPGIWAVTHSLPRKIVLLDKKGDVLKTSSSVPESIESLPHPPNTPAGVNATVLKTPHVIGLVPTADLLGIVWQQRDNGKTSYRAEWMDRDLKAIGEQPLGFSEPLTSSDFPRVTATDPFGRSYWIVYHDKGFQFTSDLYVMQSAALGKRS